MTLFLFLLFLFIYLCLGIERYEELTILLLWKVGQFGLKMQKGKSNKLDKFVHALKEASMARILFGNFKEMGFFLCLVFHFYQSSRVIVPIYNINCISRNILLRGCRIFKHSVILITHFLRLVIRVISRI